nr:putative ankyrin repeat protein [Megavirus caiporensis]
MKSQLVIAFLFIGCVFGSFFKPDIDAKLGDLSSFNLDDQPQLAYKAKLVNRYLNGTITPSMESILIVDPVNKVYYSEDPISSFYFFGNVSYFVIPPYVCQMFPDINYDLVNSQFSGLYHSTDLDVNNIVSHQNLKMYNGIIDFTYLPNAVSVTLDDKGRFLSMVWSGPADSAQLFDNVLMSTYSIYKSAKIGSTGWATLPNLPAACFQS